MKFAEINEIYTEMVSEWLNKGYTINAGTMDGHQTNEIAHIDFTNGKDIYRIVMENFTDKIDALLRVRGIRIVIGLVKDDVIPNLERRGGLTIWNDHIEAMETHCFYQITNSANRGETFWGTKDEAIEAERKRNERYCNRNYQVGMGMIDNPRAIEIARQFVARKTGKKRIKRDAIYIRKIKHGYEIFYKNKSYKMV